jgi:hypothetical protein
MFVCCSSNVQFKVKVSPDIVSKFWDFKINVILKLHNTPKPFTLLYNTVHILYSNLHPLGALLKTWHLSHTWPLHSLTSYIYDHPIQIITLTHIATGAPKLVSPSLFRTIIITNTFYLSLNPYNCISFLVNLTQVIFTCELFSIKYFFLSITHPYILRIFHIPLAYQHRELITCCIIQNKPANMNEELRHSESSQNKTRYCRYITISLSIQGCGVI